jgi:hypothetical protein
MLEQDGSQYEPQAAPERHRSQSSVEVVARELNHQVRDAVEALKLKLDNLRLFLLRQK